MISFLDLPHDDVINPLILSILDFDSLYALFNCSNNYRSLIIQFCATNKTVDFHKNPVNKAISHVFYQKSILSSTNLCCLNLPKSEEPWLDRQLITSILKSNPRLRYVSFNECASFDDHCLLVLSINCLLVSRIGFSRCLAVTNNGIDVLLSKLGSNLVHLDLSYCTGINDANQLKSSIILCTQLLSLCVAGLTVVDDDFIGQLRSCKRLKELDVSQCTKLTDVGLFLLREFLPQIKRLQCRQCTKLSYSALKYFKDRGIQLDIPVLHRTELVPIPKEPYVQI